MGDDDQGDEGATFSLQGEDHTLANAIRYMLNKSLQVEFAGYSIPHPSEHVVNIRVQTTGEVTADAEFRNSLENLAEQCDHIKSTFDDAVQRFRSQQNASASVSSDEMSE